MVVVDLTLVELEERTLPQVDGALVRVRQLALGVAALILAVHQQQVLLSFLKMFFLFIIDCLDAGGWGAPAANTNTGWGAPAANANTGWGAPAAASAAPVVGNHGNAFDRRDQMTPSQRVMWIAHMQNITQQMGSQLDAVRKSQEKRFQDVTSSLEDVKKAQDNLQANFEVSVVNKLPAAKLMHLKLAHRLVVVMKQIELLRLRNRNVSSIEEEVWRSKLQSIKKELDRPDQFSGRLKEISSRVKLQQDNVTALNSADYDAIDQVSLVLLFLYFNSSHSSHLSY
jgi:hypothetical protein